MTDSIKCPNCGTDISKALVEQIQRESALEIEKKLRIKITEETRLEQEDVQKMLKEKEEKIEEFRKTELSLREEKRKLEDDRKELALEIERKLDVQRKQVEEQVLQRAIDEHRLKDAEKDKKLTDMEKLVEELKRKAQQGSMQIQGEVLELNLEETLRTNFKDDEIQPIGKGILGADIRQIVKTPKGTTCGVILWELKRTKTFSDDYIETLKKNLRNDKADIPALVSEVMPKGYQNGLGQKNGVWIAIPALALPLAQLLRKALFDAMRQKVISQNKQSKAEELYNFITSNQFIQHVESMVSTYFSMKEQITKERAAFEKQWKQRESQVDQLLLGMAGMYGGMQGIAGSALPPIKRLELESGIE